MSGGLLIARSRVVLWHTYIGYLWMIIVGMVFELCGVLSKIASSEDETDDRAPLSDSGFFDFYLRRIYRRVEHCWNNPISSAPGASFELMSRVRSAERFNELVVVPGETRMCLNLGSYNYLGFGGVDQRCTPAAADVLIGHGLSLGSSRAEAGTLPIHIELETLCARFVRKPACVVVGMGFTTNTLTLPVLVGPGCLVISDALNHSSIVEGVRRSGAKTRVFRHNDCAHLDELLAFAAAETPKWKKVLIVVEGIYSMEGHFSPIVEIVALKKRYGAQLYLDEAHSIGAVGPTGRGVTELFGISPDDVDVMMGTFSKSFGAMGGYVCASVEIIAALKRKSASYNSSPAPPPLVCAQVIESMRIILGEDGTTRGATKLAALKHNSNYFRDALREMGCEVLGDAGSPVVPLMIYHPQKLISFSDECMKRGVAVVVVGAPATPLLEGRARFCISASHTKKDIDFALNAIREVSDAVGVRYLRPGVGPLLRRLAPPTLWGLSFGAVNKYEGDAAAVAVHAARGRVASESSPLPRERAGSIEAAGDKAKSTGPMTLNKCDPLGLTCAPRVLQAAYDSLRHYGVGSCGPRGFFGGTSAHIALEDALVAFTGRERAIAYSSGVATLSSVLSAHATRGDVIVLDDGVGYSARHGAALSRATVATFRHNDASDLRIVLARVTASLKAADRRAKRSKLIVPFATSFDGDDDFRGTNSDFGARPLAGHQRRIFIVAEGICERTGRVAPLASLVEAKEAFGCYLVLDESLSLGVLGATGRGLCEEANVDSRAVDLQVASLETVLGSVGGFCAGTNDTIFRQTLMGSGYCFSAASPPCTAAAAEEALKVITEEPWRGQDFHRVATSTYDHLEKVLGEAASPLVLGGDRGSPLLFLILPPSTGVPEAAAARRHILCTAVDDVVSSLGGSVVMCLVREVEQAWNPAPPPGEPRVKLCLSCDHAAEDRFALLTRALTALVATVTRTLEDSTAVAAAIAAAAEMAIADARDEAANAAVAGFDGKGGGGVAVATPERSRELRALEKNVELGEELSREEERRATADEQWPPRAPLLWNLIVGIVGVIRRLLQQMMVLHIQLVATSRVRVRSTSDAGDEKGAAVPAVSISGDASRLWSAWRDRFADSIALVSGAAFQCGAEVPIILWSGNHALSRRLVVAFALTTYIGNALKNLFCMPRPPRRFVHPSGLKQEETSYAWPSQYGIMAVSLPVFIGVFGPAEAWSWSAETWTGALYTYTLISWVSCGAIARVYYGLTSSADMIAGLVVGYVVSKLWVPFSSQVDSLIVGQHTLVAWAVPCIALTLVLLHPNPSVSSRSRATAPFMESLRVLGIAAGYTAAAWARGAGAELVQLPKIVPETLGAISPLALEVVSGLQRAFAALLLVFVANHFLTVGLAHAFKASGLQARLGISFSRTIMLSATATVIGAGIALMVPS